MNGPCLLALHALAWMETAQVTAAPIVQWTDPSSDVARREQPNDERITLGGSFRERLNVYQNDRFGLSNADDDGGLLLHRLLFNAELKLTEKASASVELGSHLSTSLGVDPGPFDEDQVDLHQAFLDVYWSRSRLRIGRQEMPLNSARLLSTRDGPNVRLAYDGFRLDSAVGSTQLRLFGFYPVDIERGVFDDGSNRQEGLWGLNATHDFKFSQANFYYIGYYREQARYAQGIGKETRHSIGTRWFGQHSSWDWDTELVVQFGRFGSADIRAWTLASDTGFTWRNRPWLPRVSLSTNIASGDSNPDDGALGTFNPLQPNLAYFEEAAVLAPQNFFNLEPQLQLQPAERWSLSFDWNVFWRLETNDAVYTRGLIPLPGTTEVTGRLVTHVTSISIDYQLSQSMTLDLSYSHFFAGEVIDNAGGDDIDFIKFEFEFNF
ncbi:MAG: alginate export family protein [Pseudomonadota bacterium]